jgi:predicted DNA-binding ribbon-helix-helix protein
MDKPQKRSLSITGHRTSISLEPEFWQALSVAATKQKMSVAALVVEIDKLRGNRNLSSAIRVWVLNEVLKAVAQQP